MKPITTRRILYLNERSNIIFDMELCSSLGIHYGNRKCLVVYGNYNRFEDRKGDKEEGVFLKIVDVRYTEGIYDHSGEKDIWEKGLDLESVRPYSDLLEENRKLRGMLAEIQKISGSI